MLVCALLRLGMPDRTPREETMLLKDERLLDAHAMGQVREVQSMVLEPLVNSNLYRNRLSAAVTPSPAGTATPSSGIMDTNVDDSAERHTKVITNPDSANVSPEERATAFMATFKTKPCELKEEHDHLSCPGVHSEECARRNPFEFTYSAKACPELRKHGVCSRGDSCGFAHGVLEVGLHPSRFRTHMCNLSSGSHCSRPVCFFAHSKAELRSINGVEQRKQSDAACTRILHEICVAHRDGKITKEERDGLRSLVGRNDINAAAASLKRCVHVSDRLLEQSIVSIVRDENQVNNINTNARHFEKEERDKESFTKPGFVTSGIWNYAVSFPLTPLGEASFPWKMEVPLHHAISSIRSCWSKPVSSMSGAISRSDMT